ncbi:MAG TPA: hypothetical protein VFN23_13265 [Ktedonobacteraceae bacterium]|nr:hypothetical protein [Ktedonobacteraceae bacterium]
MFKLNLVSKNRAWLLIRPGLMIIVLAAMLGTIFSGHSSLARAYAVSGERILPLVAPNVSPNTSIFKQGSTYYFSPATIRRHFTGDFTVKNTTSSAQPMLVGGHYAGTIPAHTTDEFSTLGTHQGIQTFVYHLGDHPSVKLTVIIDFAVHIAKISNVYHFVPNVAMIHDGDPLAIANDSNHSQALLYGGHYAGTVLAHHLGYISFPNTGIFQVHLGAHPSTLLKVTVKP